MIRARFDEVSENKRTKGEMTFSVISIRVAVIAKIPPIKTSPDTLTLIGLVSSIREAFTYFVSPFVLNR